MKKGINTYHVPKEQFKLWLEDGVRERLEDAADRFGRGTPQRVVEELITLYLPLWMTVNTAVGRAIQQQAQQIVVEHDEITGGEKAASKPQNNLLIAKPPAAKKRKAG